MTWLPWLHVVTDDAVLAHPTFEADAASVLQTGGSRVAVHIRGPRTPGRVLFEIAGRLNPIASEAGACLVLNDRVDVALAAGIRMVQLGQRSLTPTHARGVHPGVRVGQSCHDGEEIAAARDDGADWVFFGHVFETPSHPGRPGRGLTALGAAVAVAEAGRLPLIAIGGITAEGAGSALDAGAAGVAVLSGIWEAGSPQEATSEYISVLRARAGRTE